LQGEQGWGHGGMYKASWGQGAPARDPSTFGVPSKHSGITCPAKSLKFASEIWLLYSIGR
jgi:hypothetical protein